MAVGSVLFLNRPLWCWQLLHQYIAADVVSNLLLIISIFHTSSTGILTHVHKQVNFTII